MKMLMRSNTVVIKSEIPAEEYGKLKKFDVFTVTDEEGNDVYSISKGTMGHINTFSFKANSEYQGMLALSITFEGATPAQFAEEIKPALVALKNNETKILEQMATVASVMASIDEDIVME